MNCAVKGCKNYYRKTKNLPGETVRYFSFPRDKDVCIKWREVCANKDISVIKGRICSIHFEPSYFKQSLRMELIGYSPRKVRKLKDNAVPTLHLFNEYVENTLSSDHVDEGRVTSLIADTNTSNSNTYTDNTNTSGEGLNVSMDIDIIPEEIVPPSTVMANVPMDFADKSEKISTMSVHIDVASKKIVDASTNTDIFKDNM
ncbi:hypothetical protein ALC57_12594 [Trachymyrmex cornetzi]|uniref:THAP-type domain-containing protein n=1 Tax=Trachymyrmex cornetzi TaxID=471704 RepID=A0A151J0Y3_9HYME|nr:hypothetical protein ALC57_12594 [Trachymyrmex cornetzi]